MKTRAPFADSPVYIVALWDDLHPHRPGYVDSEGCPRTPEGHRLALDALGHLMPTPEPSRLYDVVFLSPGDDPDVAGMIDLDEVASAHVARWNRASTAVAMKGYGPIGMDIAEDFESFRKAWRGEA